MSALKTIPTPELAQEICARLEDQNGLHEVSSDMLRRIWEAAELEWTNRLEAVRRFPPVEMYEDIYGC